MNNKIRNFAEHYRNITKPKSPPCSTFTEFDFVIIVVDSTAKLTGRIQLKDITFGYDKSQAPLVKSLNLDIYPGQKIALIGPSGSGKSTIANLIIGLNWDADIEIIH